MSGKKKRRSPCPQCGKPASGNFCQHCGAQLGGRFCNECGGQLGRDARFCNECGASVAGGGARKEAAAAAVGGSNLPWWIAGVALFGLILVVGWSMVRTEAPPPQPGGASVNPAAGQSAVDLSTMTPRQAADRLFDRVMMAVSAGDTTEAVAFLPMALDAYVQAEPLDLDGLVHLSLLERLTDPEAALASARRILEADADHVLGLGAAAEAAETLGDAAAATEYFQRLLDVYDAQVARALPEYQSHEALMGILRTNAEAYLAGR